MACSGVNRTENGETKKPAVAIVLCSEGVRRIIVSSSGVPCGHCVLRGYKQRLQNNLQRFQVRFLLLDAVLDVAARLFDKHGSL